MTPRLADLAYLLGKAHGGDFNIVMVRGGKDVMNGLNAGDLDAGWGAGIQARAVKAGDMVNLASGLSTRLAVTSTMAELGGRLQLRRLFLLIAPDGIPAETREALSSAIAVVVTDEGARAGGFIRKAFGGPVVMQGQEPEALLAADEAASAELMKTASE